MDLEVCIIEAKDGNAAALVKAINETGGAALESCEGCRKVTAYEGIENPRSALLLVEWDSVDAHEAAKTADGFAKFIESIGPYVGGPASVQHFR